MRACSSVQAAPVRIRHTRYSPTAASHHAVLRGGVLTGREAAARRRCVAPRAVHGSPGAKAVVAQRRAVMVGLLGFSPWLVSVDDARATNNFGSGLEDEDSPLIQELLARSKENKAKYDKERLDDYYRRNFGDYFEFVVGSEAPSNSPEAIENRKKIEAWLAENKPAN